MQITKMELEGVFKLCPKVFFDDRGFFYESFKESFLRESGIGEPFVQDNHSFSQKNTVRGMHFQTIPGQAKLLRVSQGEIFDVAVDIRPDSPTFGKWEGVILNSTNHHQLFVPIGFAHGFCVLSEEAHVMYKVSSLYNPSTEVGFRWNDQTINIQWPVTNPIVSERDQKAPLFNELDLIKASAK